MCTASFFLAALAFFGVALYYGTILAGLLKDPMMAHFRTYGQERKVYPLPRFLHFMGLSAMLVAVLPINLVLSLMLFPAGLMALAASWFIEQHPQLKGALPRWYAHLLEETTREERRAIAWAWLRMSFRARMRLNSDAYAFHVWTDEIRLTVVYGARDPDDPWRAWQ